MEKILKEAIENLTNLRVQAVKNNNDVLERSLYDIEMLIFKAMDSSVLLPSDEEIEKEADSRHKIIPNSYNNYVEGLNEGFIQGANWVRDRNRGCHVEEKTTGRKITVSLLRDLQYRVDNEAITFSRMVELLNEHVYSPLSPDTNNDKK